MSYSILQKFILSLRENFTLIVRNVTIEPILPLYTIACILTGMAAQNLYIDKACRVNLGYSDEVCDGLLKRESGKYLEEEKEVQKLVTLMTGWKMTIQTSIPCLVILFVGSWSDRNGRRKPCMLIPVIGELLSSAGLALNVYMTRWPMEYAGLTEAFFEGITGSYTVMLMGAFSYIADITTENQRTVRIGIANTFCSIGLPIGMSLSGILLQLIGFYGVFLISVVIYLIAFLYGLFFVKETPIIQKEKKNFLVDFFNPANAIETIKVLTNSKKKKKIIMLLFVVIVVIGPMHGEQAVMYLFTRLKFDWNAVDYGLFGTYSTIMNMIGALFALLFFTYLFEMHDALVGIIGSLSKIAASFVYIFASTTWEFYLGPLVEFFHYASFICMRSIASKTVKKNERGRLNSLVGLIEALTPTIYATLYANVYYATMSSMPGTFFLVGGGLKVLAVVIFSFLYMSRKSNTEVENKRNVSLAVIDLANMQIVD